MTGAAMAMPPDPNKAFKVRHQNRVSPYEQNTTSCLLCLFVSERVGGAGGREPQVGSGGRGGEPDGPRPELWTPHHVLEHHVDGSGSVLVGRNQNPKMRCTVRFCWPRSDPVPLVLDQNICSDVGSDPEPEVQMKDV